MRHVDHLSNTPPEVRSAKATRASKQTQHPCKHKGIDTRRRVCTSPHILSSSHMHVGSKMHRLRATWVDCKASIMLQEQKSSRDVSTSMPRTWQDYAQTPTIMCVSRRLSSRFNNQLLTAHALRHREPPALRRSKRMYSPVQPKACY